MTNLGLGLKRVGRRVSRIQRNCAAAMEEIKVDPICPQSPKTLLAGIDCCAACRVARRDLGDDGDFVSAPRDGLAHQFLGTTIPVPFRCIDQSNAMIQGKFDRSHFFLSAGRRFAHAPGAYA